MTAAHGEAHAGEEKKDGAAERNCYGLTVTPSFLILLHYLEQGQIREVENEEVKLSLGKMREGRKMLF